MLHICDEKQNQLSRQYQQGILAHAILIQGTAGSGTDNLAQWLINLLVCQTPAYFDSAKKNDANVAYKASVACGQCKSCLLRESGNYPDHLLLTSENKTLGVDDIRRGNAFLEKTAQLGKNKTILIPQAQLMTVAAANALLKTLEEPSDNSYIVLITEDIDSLLPTIVSRCAVFSIRPKLGNELLAQLNHLENKPKGQADSINSDFNENAFVNVSQLPELTDTALFDTFVFFKQTFLDYLYTGKNEDKLLALLTDNQHGVRWLEKIIVNLVRQNALVGENAIFDKNSDKQITAQVFNQLYQTIIDSNKLLKSYTQTNRQFVGEQLVMMINKIVRP
ncbi:DNA polymerase III subunit [Colwellia sp. E2M01]|uniref:DNA polymerase III subunit n=1 Tax=Colwellia sp. E2M01 TaxID=2841561 RepID=UPI001C084D15|nr:DNA polymerase III subunit [Colwellia sp. E2M01]MBU2870454.1 DNA polymerase III subunit [Colwellia sp. E2M01]